QPGGPAQFEAFALLLEQFVGGDRVVHAASSRRSRERSASGPVAARSASRLPGTAKYSASSDSSCRCCWVKCSGTAIANTRSTGWPSPAWKPTGCRNRRKAARTLVVVLQRPCGIATPWPIAVLPRRSRWCRAAAMEASSAGAPPAIRRAAASSTWLRSSGPSSSAMRSGESRECRGMRVGPVRGSGEVAAARGALGAAHGVDLLFLVLDQEAVELVGEQVDRGVDGHAVGLGMQGVAGEVDRRLRALLGLDHAEQRAHVQGLFEMASQPRELRLDVIADGGGDFDLLPMGFDAHLYLLGPSRLSGTPASPGTAAKL